MLEQKIDALTEAVKELTAVFKSGAVAKPAATTAATPAAPKAETKPAAPTVPKISAEELKTLALKHKDAKTAAVTTALIKETTGAGKLSEVKPEDFRKLYDALTAALEAPADDDDV